MFEHPDLDTMCFPELYPDGKYGENYEREIEVKKSDFARSKLLNKDHKFRQSIPYLFYLHNLKVLRELSNGINATMYTHKNKSMTRNEMLNKIENGELDQDISLIFSNVRGTEENLKIPRLNLQSMLRNYGPATWFLTFSPTEWLWPELKGYLLKINENFTESMSIAELTAKDPVSTAIFINNRFEAFLKFLTSADNPLGKINHHFIRREYQGRGVSHFHCLLWVEDSPTIGVDSEEKIAQFYYPLNPNQ